MVEMVLYISLGVLVVLSLVVAVDLGIIVKRYIVPRARTSRAFRLVLVLAVIFLLVSVWMPWLASERTRAQAIPRPSISSFPYPSGSRIRPQSPSTFEKNVSGTAAARRCEDTKAVVVSNTVDDNRKTGSSNTLQVSGIARNTCNYPLSARLRITALAEDGSVLGTTTRGPLELGTGQEQPFVVWLNFSDLQRPTGRYGSVLIVSEIVGN